jgi:hypothetical protein
MQDDRCPPCIIRTSPTSPSTSVEITYLAVAETENLLDSQEELVGTPLKVKFDPKVYLTCLHSFQISLLFLSLKGK